MNRNNRTRIPIPIRTTNRMSILYRYYAELFTLHGVNLGSHNQLSVQEWNWNRDRNLHL